MSVGVFMFIEWGRGGVGEGVMWKKKLSLRVGGRISAEYKWWGLLEVDPSERAILRTAIASLSQMLSFRMVLAVPRTPCFGWSRSLISGCVFVLGGRWVGRGVQ